MNNLISIDLHKQYNKINSKNLNNINSNLKSLISQLYSIESYNFNYININNFIDQFIHNNNLSDNDLLLLNQNKLINQQLLDKYNQGLILFNLSCINDDNLIQSIYNILINYQDVKLNKLYDNYLIFFQDKVNEFNQIDFQKLKNIISNIFKEDLNKLLLDQKIKLIPNDKLKKKLKFDLEYSNLIKNIQYHRYYFNENLINKDLINYEKSLYLDIFSDNYRINYIFDNYKIYQYINEETLNDILNKLKNINFSFFSNQSDNKFNLDDLFDINKLKSIYQTYNQNQIEFIMNDVLDDKFNIVSRKKESLTFENFYSNVIYFLNELIKRKIIKTVKLYNYTINKEQITNHFIN